MRSPQWTVVVCAALVLGACGAEPVDLGPFRTEVKVTPGEVVGSEGGRVAPGVPLSAAQWGPNGTILLGRWGASLPVGNVDLRGCEPGQCAALEEAMRERLIQRARHEAQSLLSSLLSTKRWYVDAAARAQDAGASGGFAGTGGSAGSGGSGGSGGAAGSSGTAGSGPNDYTTTNTQHADVDEADIVKNDGTRLFVLSGRRLSLLRSWPAKDLAEQGAMVFDFTPRDMYLRGDQVLVLGDPGLRPSYSPYDYYYAPASSVEAQLLDVSNLSTPRTVARWTVPGRLSSSRRHGNVVRVVTTASTPWDYGVIYPLGVVRGLPYSHELRDTPDATLVAKCWDIALRAEAVLRARSFSQLFPQAQRFNGQDVEGAARLFLPTGEVSYGATHVATLDLDSPAPASIDTLLARTGLIYSSSQSLYVATTAWDWWGTTSTTKTQLHKLALATTGGVQYAGSGEVVGTIDDQFSLDEHGDVLRVAHTQWDWSSSSRTQNFVSTLRASNGRLVTLGRTDPLAPGERIMSARFVGDVGYVVTFRQTDPLYTLDLSNPANPHVVGELHIPGFSSYIHPIDPTHLLTIGTYVNPPGTSFARAVQLALFDVSDLAHPRQTHVQLIGGASSSSSAQWDHHAFTYFAARRTVAIPFSTWDQGQFTSDLRVFTVDPATGFTNKGALSVEDLLKRDTCSWANAWGNCWTWWWQPSVQRSVMADEFVYAIGSGGVRVATVDALHQPVATVAFPKAY